MNKSFQQFLVEAAEQRLDIKIPSLFELCAIPLSKSKVDASKITQVKQVLTQPLLVEEKFDGCLDYNTEIDTLEFGKKKIGDIVENDLKCSVLSFNTSTQTKEYKPISAVKKKSVRFNWVKLISSDPLITLIVTNNHWIWSETEKNYKQVRFLKEGEQLLASSGSTLTLKRKQMLWWHYSNRYDLEIQDNKNYFANGILVHNTKLNLIRNFEPFDETNYENNWIVSYKNNILNAFEFEHINNDEIKKESHGISQYKLIHDLLKQKNKLLKEIEPGTEFFLEFLMEKPTLTQNYQNAKHALILLGNAKLSSIKKRLGQVFSTQSHEFVHNPNNPQNLQLLSGLKIAGPPVVFSGTLFSESGEFNVSGCEYAPLKHQFSSEWLSQAKDAFLALSPQGPWESHVVGKTEKNVPKVLKLLAQPFLSYPSSYGKGRIEGSVFMLGGFDGKERFKIVQEDQYSLQKRKDKKQSLHGDEQTQKNYFAEISKKAQEVFDILYQTEQDQTAQTFLKEGSKRCYSLNLKEIDHPTKTNLNKQDDLYLTFKMLVLNHLPFEPDDQPILSKLYQKKAGVIIGKFRLPTNKHFELIQSALKQSKELIVFIVFTEKQKGLSFDERKSILTDAFPSLVVEQTQSANLHRLLSPIRENVSSVFCGSDREQDYQEQLDQFNKKYETDIGLSVLNRAEDDEISSTQLESYLVSGNEQDAKKITHLFNYIDSGFINNKKAFFNSKG